jgi:hypothetical protein
MTEPEKNRGWSLGAKIVTGAVVGLLLSVGLCKASSPILPAEGTAHPGLIFELAVVLCFGSAGLLLIGLAMLVLGDDEE